MLAPVGRAVDVVVPEAGADRRGDRVAQVVARRRGAARSSRTGRRVEAVTVSAALPSASSVPTSRAAERPFGLRLMRRNAARRRSAAAGRSIARRISPSRSAVRRGPSTKSIAGTRRSPPSGVQIVQTPSRATASAAIGPAGSARQRLPPTVAVFQTLKEPSSARQHWPTSGAAVQAAGSSSRSRRAKVQVAASDRPLSVTAWGVQPRPARSTRRSSAGCGSENSQVPPASQASPGRQAGSSARARGRATALDRVQVHRGSG